MSEMSMVDWINYMLSDEYVNDDLTKTKFKQLRHDWDAGHLSESKWRETIEKMMLAGGYEGLGD